MTNSANDFLGYLIENKNENNECSYEIIKKYETDCLNDLLEELLIYNCIKREVFECVRVTQTGIESYVSNAEIVDEISFKISKKIITWILSFIGTVLSGLFIAWLTNHFGW